MLTWFRETAPIRLKTKVAFGLQAALVMLAGLSAAMVPVAHISVLVSLGIAGSALAISVVTGFLMARAISEPYVATVVRMEALAAGDLTSPIAYTSYKDCVGRMTVAMHTFKEGALAKREAERRADETRSSADGERSRREAERAAHAGEIEAAINGLAVALSELAEGNVAYRIEMPFKGDADRLRIDFNASMEKLQQVLATVGANAQGIRIGSKEVAVAADELAKRTEKQAASLEETAAALDGITVTVRKTAEGALHARQVVATAKGDAETSGAVAQDAIEAMKGIATSSRQIGQIIGVIDEIAFQTNLLALNAGVEAARAGEAGRGFAVVASEVRALAQRSAEAAKEIKTLISNSASHVDHGVELVIETGNALTRIVNHVAEISAVVTAIAESAQEQSVGLQEVNVAVTQMDQMTQQNAAMVEESTAASHSMMQEAEGLTKILGRFNLGDEPKVVEFAPVRTQGKTSVSKAAAVRPAISGGHGAARGSAVRKAAPVEAEEGWEEF